MKKVILFEQFTYPPNRAYVTRIIKFNQKTFKLVYDVRNGGKDLDLFVMSLNGEFKNIAWKYTVGFESNVSYVSDTSKKYEDAIAGFILLEDFIEKVYS